MIQFLIFTDFALLLFNYSTGYAA